MVCSSLVVEPFSLALSPPPHQLSSRKVRSYIDSDHSSNHNPHLPLSLTYGTCVYAGPSGIESILSENPWPLTARSRIAVCKPSSRKGLRWSTRRQGATLRVIVSWLLRRQFLDALAAHVFSEVLWCAFISMNGDYDVHVPNTSGKASSGSRSFAKRANSKILNVIAICSDSGIASPG